MQTIYIENAAQLNALKAAIKVIAATEGPIGVDTETLGLDPMLHWVRLIQIAVPDFALVVDLQAFRDNPNSRQVDWDRPGLNYIRMVLEGVNRPKIFHNASFDINMLWQEGIDVGGELHDTMIAAKIINNGTNSSNKLKDVHRRILGKEMPTDKETNQKGGWDDTITGRTKGAAFS